jgi:hypothetical protein
MGVWNIFDSVSAVAKFNSLFETMNTYKQKLENLYIQNVLENVS